MGAITYSAAFHDELAHSGTGSGWFDVLCTLAMERSKLLYFKLN